MGTLTRATCDDCGYSAEVVFGGTRNCPHEDQLSPFVCTDCREVVSVLENRIPLVCGKCGLQNVAPLEAPQRPLVLAEEEQKKVNLSRNISAIIKFIAGTYEAKGKARAPNVGKMLRAGPAKWPGAGQRRMRTSRSSGRRSKNFLSSRPRIRYTKTRPSSGRGVNARVAPRWRSMSRRTGGCLLI